jgi:hypothetical protein
MLLEGCLEIGAKAIAEAFFGLQKNSNNQLEGVFYHNGVVANVYVEASFEKENDLFSTTASKNSKGGYFTFKSNPKRVTARASQINVNQIHEQQKQPSYKAS